MALGIALVALMIYVLERSIKWLAVEVFMRRQRKQLRKPPQLITVIQPILSGDPHLPSCLAHNLSLAHTWPLQFIWLVDDDDVEGQAICQTLIESHPSVDIRLDLMPRGGARQSPKMLKLQRGIALSEGEVVVVLDDDTMLPDEDLESCLAELDDPRVGLSFGLPYYVAFDTWPASFVSCFVNSNSLLTYIPYTFLTPPFTINGMFYAMRREQLRAVDDFAGLEQILADDFAVARRFSERGFMLAQSRLRHGIQTHVKGWRGYFQLLRRWLVFPRESIMRELPWRELVMAHTLALVPCLLPLVMLGCFVASPNVLTGSVLASSILLNLLIFIRFNLAYLRSATPWPTWILVPAVQLLIPIQLIVALMLPQRIVWRGHVIQVEKGGTFTLLSHRADRPEETTRATK